MRKEFRFRKCLGDPLRTAPKEFLSVLHGNARLVFLLPIWHWAPLAGTCSYRRLWNTHDVEYLYTSAMPFVPVFWWDIDCAENVDIAVKRAKHWHIRHRRGT